MPPLRPPLSSHRLIGRLPLHRQRISTLLAIVTLLTLVIPARRARAQSLCSTDNPPCIPPANAPPTIAISPASGVVAASDVVVSIFVSDDRAVSPSSLAVYVNGVRDAGFTLGASTLGSATSSRTLHLSGTTTISASISDTYGLTASTSVTLQYAPPPPAPDSATPTVSVWPSSGNRRDLGCAGCAVVAAAYSTPAYTSLDVARSITLVYSSARAYPMALVQVDALVGARAAPSAMSLRLRRNGADQRLTNDSTAALFVGALGTSRLAAQFDASTLPTGAYRYDAIVGARWGGELAGAPQSVRVLVVNDANSPYGAGWSIAGLARLYFTNDDGGVLLFDGSEVAEWFAPCGSGCYTSPAGDYSTLAAGTVAGEQGFVRTFRNGSAQRFDAAGRLVEVRDRWGSAIRYAYDASSRLVSVVDPVGQTTQLRYAPDASCTLSSRSGTLCSIVTPGGRSSRIEVNASNELDLILDADDVAEFRGAYQSNGSHRLVARTDRTGGQTTFDYDAFGQLASIAAPAIQTTDAGMTSPTTYVTSLERQILPSTRSARPRVVPESAVVTVVSPRGAATRIATSRLGAPTRVEERLPTGKVQISTITYDGEDRIIAMTTPEGGETHFEWDGPRLTAAVDYVLGDRVDYGYDGAPYDQLAAVRQNGVLVQQAFYNASGPYAGRAPDSVEANSAATNAADRLRTRFTYDAFGRVATLTDPQLHRTAVTFDVGGFANSRAVTASGRTTQFAYDAFGRPQSSTNPLAQTVAVEWDNVNRARTITAPLNAITRFGYDDGARAYSVTDARGQLYRDSLNAAGWLVKRTDPRGASEYFEYDRHGNVTKYTNRRGGTMYATYDELDRVVTRTASGQTFSYAYDDSSRWIAASGPTGTDTIFVDRDGNTVREVGWHNGFRTEVQSTYNTAGMRNTLKAIGSRGWTRSLDFGYDAIMRPNYLADFAGRGTSVAYSADGLPARVTLPTGTSSTSRLHVATEYDDQHLPSSISYDQGLGATLTRSYSHDPLGRVQTTDRGVYGDTRRRTHGYDALGRLASTADERIWMQQVWVQECSDPSGVYCDGGYYDTQWNDDPVASASYSYDAVGNRTDHGAVIGAGNRLTSFNGIALTYDADGNLVRKAKPGAIPQQLSWNDFGQLTRVEAWSSPSTPSYVMTFTYDGFGRRIAKSGTIRAATRYVYDGTNIVMELTDAGDPIREYSYYPGVDRPHAVRQSSSGAVFYYATEEPGTITGLVSASNALVNSYSYDVWGTPTTQSEQIAQPFRFAGREFDDETGLYYNRARYYDPELGRFISEDPIGLAGGINKYAYAGNDPVNATDPSGTCPEHMMESYYEFDDGTRVPVCIYTLGGMNTNERGVPGKPVVYYPPLGTDPGYPAGGGAIPLGGIAGGIGVANPNSVSHQDASCTHQAHASGLKGAKLGAVVGGILGAVDGTLIGLGSGVTIGSAVGGVIGTSVGPVGTIVGAAIGGATIGSGTAFVGGWIGAHVGFVSGGVAGYTGAYFSTYVQCILDRS